MEKLSINHEPVALYQALKFGNMVMGGGEAKIMILNGMVSVNGETAFEKRKKVYAGDIIEFDGRKVELVLSSSPQPKTTKVSNPVKAEKQTAATKNVDNSIKKARKPISF